MVKLKKNKLKELNKINKKSPTNKILKKKLNLEKKVTFQKEILLKETVKSDSLVKTVKSNKDILRKLSKKPTETSIKTENEDIIPKHRPVEKKKKRQKTQVCDTKLILSLMKKKFNEKGDAANVHY